jgi:hypothetical protein
MHASLRQHAVFMGPSFCRGVLKLDLASAFNERHRCLLLQNVLRMPGIADTAPLMHATLSPAGLIAGLDSTSDDGVRQGDGMSSLALCALIDPIAKEEHELGQRTGDYGVFDVDDGYISGPTPNFMRIFKRTQTALVPLGLRMATHKCQLFVNDVTHARNERLKFPESPVSLGCVGGLDSTAAPNGHGFGIMCAGIPLGDEVFVRAALEKKILKFEQDNSTLTALLRDVTSEGLAAITLRCQQPIFGWGSQVMHPDAPRPQTDRPFTTTNVFGLCGSGLRCDTRCHGQHFYATPPMSNQRPGHLAS